MELKSFTAQDLEGKAMAGAYIHVYQPGTVVPVVGLQSATGMPLTNPFQADANGLAQLALPDGNYDIRILGSGRDFTRRVEFFDSKAAREQSAADRDVVLAARAEVIEVALEAVNALTAAPLVRGYWPSTAAGIGNGVAGAGTLTAGAGGADGTYPLVTAGGDQQIPARGWVLVEDGGITRVHIDHPGYYNGTPVLDLSAITGLAGAEVPLVLGPNTPVGGSFIVGLQRYRVDPGPLAVADGPPMASAAELAILSNALALVAGRVTDDAELGQLLELRNRWGQIAMRLTAAGLLNVQGVTLGRGTGVDMAALGQQLLGLFGGRLRLHYSDAVTAPLTIADRWGAIGFRVQPDRVIGNGVGGSSGGGSVVPAQLDAMQQLARACRNPLHSVYMRFIGDSITWGMNVTGQGEKEPRNHALSDPRNNLTSPSWVNLIRQFLGATFCDGEVVADAPGAGYYQKVHFLDPSQDARLVLLDRITGAALTKVATTDAGARFGRSLLLSAANNANGVVEFDLVGDNFTVVYGLSNAGSPETSVFEVLVDGALVATQSYYGAPANGQSLPLSLTAGAHKVRIRNAGDGAGVFALEAVRVTHKIRVANDGISGTWTGEWTPSGSLLSGSLGAADEFVFVQLGTNDRGQSGAPLDPLRTKNNLRGIGQYITNSMGKKLVLLCANAVLESEASPGRKYGMREVSRVIRELGDELACPVIDQYLMTNQLKLDGVPYMSDTVHPDDAGHRAMFDNWKRRFLAAGE